MPRTAAGLITHRQAEGQHDHFAWLCSVYERQGLRLATVEWGPHVPLGAAFLLTFTDEPGLDEDDLAVFRGQPLVGDHALRCRCADPRVDPIHDHQICRRCGGVVGKP